MIYHIALASDWQAALEAGEYRVSDRRSHARGRRASCTASFANQVRTVADAHYAGVQSSRSCS